MNRALLVIDIQNDYFPGGALALHAPEQAETRVVAAIRHAKTSGDRVILVRHVSAQPTGLLAKGGDGIAIRPAILAAAGDVPVVTKSVPDAFQGTDLAEHLRGVQSLTICGMMTQNCVAFTAMSRAADAFQVQVAGALCAAPSEAVHRIALNALESKNLLATDAG